jgi:type IV pilus assembly protein PilM
MSFFTNQFLSQPDASVIGIDIGSSSLKIVQIKKEKGRAILQTYGEISFGPYNNLSNGQIVILNPDQSAKIILDLLKEVNILTLKGGMSIPLKLSLISLVDIPKVDEKEERSVIEFEAKKYIPVSMSEISLDYFIIPKSDDDSLEFIESDNYKVFETEKIKQRQKVLLVAIHNQVLENYSKIVQKANLSIDFFEVEAFATVRACLRSETTPVMIVDLGASSVKVYVIENGLLVASDRKSVV